MPFEAASVERSGAKQTIRAFCHSMKACAHLARVDCHRKLGLMKSGGVAPPSITDKA